MAKFGKILKHYPLSIKDRKKVKKVILKTEKYGTENIEIAHDENKNQEISDQRDRKSV